MKTLLVTGHDPAPEALRAIVAHGSTSLDTVTADELVTFVSAEALGVDRIVFWNGAGDEEVRALAVNYAAADGRDRAQHIFFVTAARNAADAGLGSDIVFVWPDDLDKLKMVFMTGA